MEPQSVIREMLVEGWFMNIEAFPIKEYPPRVLVTKIGLDGHDRGSRVIARLLRDAGMEVIYTGPWQSIANIVNMALEEDIDVIGVSSLATDHLLIPKLMRELEAAELGHVAVVVGGIIPNADEVDLLKAGVARVFHAGGAIDGMTDDIRDLALAARASRSDISDLLPAR